MLLFFNRLHASYIFFLNPNELYILLKKILIASACLFRIIKKKNNVNFPILLFCYLIFQIDLTNFEEHIIYIVYLNRS